MNMKCSDLQIGDYVRFKRTKEPVWVFEIDGDRNIINNEPDGYCSEKNIGIDDVEPIPLTPEILERNGFNKVPQQGCSNPYYWMMEKYEEESEELLYRIKAYKTLFRGMCVSIDNYADCEPIKYSKQMEHVHELQNALRICSLNDLADNFKLDKD
jgi:hypothetical protein